MISNCYVNCAYLLVTKKNLNQRAAYQKLVLYKQINKQTQSNSFFVLPHNEFKQFNIGLLNRIIIIIINKTNHIYIYIWFISLCANETKKRIEDI